VIEQIRKAAAGQLEQQQGLIQPMQLLWVVWGILFTADGGGGNGDGVIAWDYSQQTPLQEQWQSCCSAIACSLYWESLSGITLSISATSPATYY
jgi:hypothetical protein